ncbi:BIRC5 [Bugula neritina]|uniref:BIRC5 n=1 Tax=Bugula neritina TaxID=10212 RepID=A0A7J7JPX0_BUGNE|nr:BIRC5 [Bugula neritina]
MGDLESNASLLAQTNASASSSGFESFSVNGSCEKDVLQAQMAILKDLKYVVEENRKNTFVNWPFEEKAKGTKRKLKIKCTVEAMAEAGFVHTPTDESPDAAKCFFCCKELDGWEEQDDPWEEHVSHSRGKCEFLKKARIYETDITRKEFLEMEIHRQKNVIRAKYELLAQRLKDQALVVREKMISMVDK